MDPLQLFLQGFLVNVVSILLHLLPPLAVFHHLIDVMTARITARRCHAEEFELILSHPQELSPVNLSFPVRGDGRRSGHLVLEVVRGARLSSFRLPFLSLLLLQRVAPPFAHPQGLLYPVSAPLVLLDDRHSLVGGKPLVERIFLVEEGVRLWICAEDHLVVVVNLVLPLFNLLPALFVVEKQSRDSPLHSGRIQFEVCQHLIQSHEVVLRSRVVKDELLFQLQDPGYGALHHFLNAPALLRVDHLVMAVLQFLVDLQVLDVQIGKVLETRLKKLTILRCLRWKVLDLHLVHELLHAFRPFVLVGCMRHGTARRKK
mmetsp:Transcript_14249/g.38745  ORF Transcript_14249/g.38745 Transcript_14249/m.38745 type:complete len:316 (-) Transcript_14249:27-974(-)